LSDRGDDPQWDAPHEAAEHVDRLADPASGGTPVNSAPPLASIVVGVVLERRKARSAWVDFSWAPVAVLPGAPAAAPWTVLAEEAGTTRFYAGAAEIALSRTETRNSRDNLASGPPSLWVALRPTVLQPPYAVLAVTADPAEGEAFTK